MTRLTYGGIAQLARAFGSYPECRWFESNCRYQFWPGGQEVKTPPFHGGNTSSILVRVTRATKQMSQSADQKFVRSGFWHLYFLGRVAQLVRALASHARGPRFESVRVHHEKSTCRRKCFFQRNKSLSGFVKCPAGVNTPAACEIAAAVRIYFISLDAKHQISQFTQWIISRRARRDISLYESPLRRLRCGGEDFAELQTECLQMRALGLLYVFYA